MSAQFWTLIELAWLDAERSTEGALRHRILGRKEREVDAAMDPFFDALARVLARELSRDAFDAFVAELDHHVLGLKSAALEKHMRARHLAFLGGRFRTVALGERHYNAVRKAPRAALVVTDADSTIAALWRMYDLRFTLWAPPARHRLDSSDSGVRRLRESA